MRRRARNIMGVMGGGWRARGLWALMMVLMIVGSAATAGIAHADPGAMQVVVPTPSSDGTTVQGPVHTNVSVSATQATAGATFTLGWAAQSDGCTDPSKFHPFADSDATVNSSSGGNFTATVVWPNEAGDPNTLYSICAVDTANPADIIVAAEAFQVLSTNSPQINLSQAPNATAPANGSDNYYQGGEVVVNGQNFLPKTTAISIYLTTSQTFSAQDLSGTPLTVVGGGQVTSDDQGSFTATVLLASNFTGQAYIHAVSGDGIADGPTPLPPSLVADHTINIAAPLATPTVKPSPSPKVTKTPGAGAGPGGNGGSTNHPRRIAAAIGLGILSLILFIVGGILIASVALGPKDPTSQANSSPNLRDPVRSDLGW